MASSGIGDASPAQSIVLLPARPPRQGQVLAEHLRGHVEAGRSPIVMTWDESWHALQGHLVLAGADPEQVCIIDAGPGDPPTARTPSNIIIIPSPAFLELAGQRAFLLARQRPSPVIIVDGAETMLRYNGPTTTQQYYQYLSATAARHGVPMELVMPRDGESALASRLQMLAHAHASASERVPA